MYSNPHYHRSYRWEIWEAGEKVASQTTHSMTKAMALAEAFLPSRPALCVRKITTPTGTDYILTHGKDGPKWARKRS